LEVESVIARKILAVSMAALFMMMLSSCRRPPSRQEAVVEIGLPAPKFKLPDLKGQEVSLDQFKGKVVMLDFWATWCGPCQMTMPVIEKLEKEYSDTLIVLAINLQESKDEVAEYAKRQAVTSRVLLDESGSVGATYGTDSIPMQFLIDKNGIVRHVQMGYSPKMASQLRAQIEQLR
jgi:thiol-disulfide isomerase/thioredoxin